MFTGIVNGLGRLARSEARDQGRRIRVTPASGDIDLAQCRQGDSISVCGVCLTMLHPDDSGFDADISAETLALTTLGSKREGDLLNLELALRATDRLGGHIVSGHVDCRARLLSCETRGEAQEYVFSLPVELQSFVCRKGSISLDGVSLTVNSAGPDSFSVCVIPHTLEMTTLGDLAVGDDVNLEVDLIARYVERMM